jgi:hypothetical protein
MPLFHEIVGKENRPPEWPYPILYDHEQEIDTDVLVIGGGMAFTFSESARRESSPLIYSLTSASVGF